MLVCACVYEDEKEGVEKVNAWVRGGDVDVWGRHSQRTASRVACSGWRGAARELLSCGPDRTDGAHDLDRTCVERELTLIYGEACAREGVFELRWVAGGLVPSPSVRSRSPSRGDVRLRPAGPARVAVASGRGVSRRDSRLGAVARVPCR